jgi:hypothetical protein
MVTDGGTRHNQMSAKNTAPGKRREGVGLVLFGGFLVTLLLIATAAAVDNGAGSTNPTVIVSTYQVTPAVLLPGDEGMITLTIMNTAQSATLKENTGSVTGGTFEKTRSTDINVFVENVHMEGNGILVLTNDFDRLGEIGPGQSVPVTFVIQAPERSGIYFPEAWIDVKDGRSTRYPFTVNVNTDLSTLKKPSLSVIQDLPERVAPGESCTARVTIRNNGLTRASDISVTVNSSTKSLVLTTPGRSWREQLNPGGEMNLTLGFATDKNTPIGIDPVTLAITYRNPDGNSEKQTETLGIPVKGRAALSVKSLSTDPVRPAPGSPFMLVVRVENTGTDQATSVKTSLDSPFSGTKTAFIGSVDKNSDAPAVFYLQATKDGTVPANLTISYLDDFGAHEITEQAAVATAPGQGLLPAAAILIALGIVGAVYWYLRIRPGKLHAGE